MRKQPQPPKAPPSRIINSNNRYVGHYPQRGGGIAEMGCLLLTGIIMIVITYLGFELVKYLL